MPFTHQLHIVSPGMGHELALGLELRKLPDGLGDILLGVDVKDVVPVLAYEVFVVGEDFRVTGKVTFEY